MAGCYGLEMLKAASGRFVDVALLLCRLALGLYFLLAGWFKVLGEFREGFGSFYRGPGYQGLEPDFLPELMSKPYGYALPWAELVFGLLLVVGLLSRISAGAIALMMLSFLIAQLYADFGGNLRPGPGPFNTNFILLALAVLLVATGPGRLALDAALGRGRRRGKADGKPTKKPGPRL